MGTSKAAIGGQLKTGHSQRPNSSDIFYFSSTPEMVFLLENKRKYSLKHINGEVEHSSILKKKREYRKLSTFRKTGWEINGCIKLQYGIENDKDLNLSKYCTPKNYSKLKGISKQISVPLLYSDLIWK
jgi:hypothetical protein